MFPFHSVSRHIHSLPQSVSTSVFPSSDYCVIMICIYIIIGYQFWRTFLSGSLFFIYFDLFLLFIFCWQIKYLIWSVINPWCLLCYCPSISLVGLLFFGYVLLSALGVSHVMRSINVRYLLTYLLTCHRYISLTPWVILRTSDCVSGQTAAWQYC